jgi:hypothetical protein
MLWEMSVSMPGDTNSVCDSTGFSNPRRIKDWPSPVVYLWDNLLKVTIDFTFVLLSL